MEIDANGNTSVHRKQNQFCSRIVDQIPGECSSAALFYIRLYTSRNYEHANFPLILPPPVLDLSSRNKKQKDMFHFQTALHCLHEKTEILRNTCLRETAKRLFSSGRS